MDLKELVSKMGKAAISYLRRILNEIISTSLNEVFVIEPSILAMKGDFFLRVSIRISLF